ncbi:MAG: riboflavin synthase [Acaryochloridaceae cyanobacterium SU_2_1]|nr:riboflavin synthase [Acaryochloridaceae cyanobacterium SU_2_1]NJM95597.1 riboflavin synthase [Acaryochloridaceae cyanobacterium CSU_5_19]
MFTGLIRGFGYLRSQTAHQIRVQWAASPPWTGLALGDSVAVDGVCLTAEALIPQGFLASVSPETLDRTTLGQRLNSQTPVNLEPALRVGDALGGHFVCGHIDGVGLVTAIDPTETAWELSFTVPDSLAPYIVPKGSVAVNGVSLTIAACNGTGTEFKVAVIPHSFTQTNLQFLSPGHGVNIETDLLGKYVAKLLHTPPAPALETIMSRPEITLEFLASNGFG